MGAVTDEQTLDYRTYLERFDATLGTCEIGGYAKHRGRLIKKLRFDEYVEKFREYREVDELLKGIFERGDTVNDTVLKLLRERADELVLPAPPGAF
ncbi:MAG: hypothetical protein EXR73_06310 [Myxococcales bacterium]|nr:hypothetical protein [Myxococcales bacterium]